MKTPNIAHLLFQTLSNPCSFYCLVSLAKMYDAMMQCVILLNDVMDINLLTLGTLALTALRCVLCATRNQIY